MKNENRAVFDRASETCVPTLGVDPVPAAHPAAGTDQAPGRWSIGSSLRTVVLAISRQYRVRRNRMALLELTDDQLKDIGISRSQAYGGHSRYRRGGSAHLERKCL